MGSKFIEKHKRKSLLALLLLLFKGRNKYIVLLIMIILFSIPFVATSDMIERFFGLSPVRYAIKFLGLESVMSSLNPKYSTDITKTLFEKLKDEYDSYSLWNKIRGSSDEERRLKGKGSIELVKLDEIQKLQERYRKDKDGKKGKYGNEGRYEEEELDGVIDKEEVEKGKGAEGVNLDGILGRSRGVGEFGEGFASDIYGGSFASSRFGSSKDGGNVAWTFGKYSSHDKYGPYLAKDFLKSKGYASKQSIASVSLNNIKNNIPEASNPNLGKAKVKVSKMGSLTAFNWKNVGYTKQDTKAKVNVSGSKRALFQMGETLATTSMAYLQKPAYETQAVYTAATYDGIPLSGNVINADGDPVTSMPDTAYVSEVTDSVQHWEEIAKKCEDAQKVHGTRISTLQKEMDEITKTMGKPPKCCSSAVHKWNAKVKLLVAKCNELNEHSKALGQECGNSNPQIINCQQTYGKLYIKPCSKWICWLGIILAIIGLLIGFMIGGFLGAVIGAAIGFAVGFAGSMYMQMAAMGAAFAGAGAYFADKESEKAIQVTEEINKDVAKQK